MHEPFRKSARSYTLIELIMVMAVLALAAAILIPNMSFRNSLTVQGVVRLLIADLSFAQSDALANQQYRRVVFTPDTSLFGCSLCFSNPISWIRLRTSLMVSFSFHSD